MKNGNYGPIHLEFRCHQFEFSNKKNETMGERVPVVAWRIGRESQYLRSPLLLQ